MGLLVIGGTTAKGQFWLIDPGAPEVRMPLVAPPGRWTVATSTGGLALSSGTGPATVVLARTSALMIVAERTVHLPADDTWEDGYAACIAPSGDRFLAADAGLTFYLFTGGSLLAIPGQKNNRGSCTWITDDVAVWDGEDGRVWAWSASTNTVSAAPLEGVDGSHVSSGGSILSWVTGDGVNVLARVTIDEGRLRVGPEIGRNEAVSNGALAPDGSWLVTRELSGTASLYLVADGGLQPRGHVALAEDEQVAWIMTGER